MVSEIDLAQVSKACAVCGGSRVEGGEAMGQAVARLFSDDKPQQALGMLRAMAQAQVGIGGGLMESCSLLPN